MRYHVLACDYDGTIAHHGTVDPATVDALAAVKKSGRRLVLVTGRELDDLSRVFAELTLFDRIVAENGALLYDPGSRGEKPLGASPNEALVRRLEESGVNPLSVGKVIVATWSPHEHAVLEAIHELGLELQVIFNKGAVMVLPTGINKASGLTAALADLKLSAHNAVAVGDAENDHALLKLCECGVAVENALPALKDAADYVTRGDHGRGVRELCDLLLREDLCSLEPRLTRRRIPIGGDVSDAEFTLPAHGGAVMVAGTSGGGKSTFTTAILEQLIEDAYQVCIVDPEGDYEHFEGAVILGTSDNPPTVSEVLEVLDDPSRSVAVNILALDIDERPAFAGKLFPELLSLRSATGRPHWVVTDESHHLFPREWQAADAFVTDSLANYLLITVHPDHITSAVLETVQTLIAIGADPEGTIADFCTGLGLPEPPSATDRDPDDDAVLWHVDTEDPPVRFRARSPNQKLRRHLRKYAEGKLGEDRSFYFRGPDGKVRLRAYNLASFMDLGDGVDEETWLYHLKRRDYSVWIRTSIKDDQLAEEIAAVEAAPDIRAADSRARIREAIEQRYTLPV